MHNCHRTSLGALVVLCLSPSVFVVALILLGGCNRGPTLVPVAGKIEIDGQPVTQGYIVMYQEGYRSATAKIESDGSFAFKTLKDRDGCLLGEHAIAVMSNEAISETSTKFFIPQRYGDVKTADTKIKIEEATDQLMVNLTWKGTPHAEPYIVRIMGSAN